MDTGLAIGEYALDGVAEERRDGTELALDRLLEALGMEVATVSEIEAGTLVVRAAAGATEAFGLSPGLCLPSRETWSARLLLGLVPRAVPDTADEPERPLRERGLNGVAAGAFVGAPLVGADGSAFGVLGCAHRQPQEHLGDREAGMVEMVAGLLARDLERERARASATRAAETETRIHSSSAAVVALLAALDARESGAGTHSQAVVDLAVQVGRELGMSAALLTETSQVALLHDVGKLGIPDALLAKPGPLDPEEWALMRSHPVIGAQIVESVDTIAHLAPAIRAQRERWDGRGYPDGLAGEAVPESSRVVFACAALHAMTADRPHRDALPRPAALRELARNRGTQFAPSVVDALIASLSRPGVPA